MLLSGIVLAGANDVPDGPHPPDGVWTAEEIATNDLESLKVVVLSACDTGRGATRSGEGVMGLRRAFSAAGNPATIMSLWTVPDAPTTRLMGDFYRALSERKARPAGALRKAQLAALARNRSQYGAGFSTSWAAFVVAGQVR